MPARRLVRNALILFIVGAVLLARNASAQPVQFLNSPYPIDGAGSSIFGGAGALSTDGTTLVVGGPADASQRGATWAFLRENGVWVQQGAKLIGTGAAASAGQGTAVAVSGDGNTLATGAPSDNAGGGASWVFVRNAGAWTQQGLKLVGAGAVGAGNQGFALALSADGNTLAIGGPYDNANVGGTWIFTRTNGTWTQQGARLLGTGAVGPADQGYGVALSADGNTLATGAPGDNAGAGAVWIFTRSANTWTQQGTKLVGTGSVGVAQQGLSVALSADGKTLAEGGNFDNSQAGAAWIFTRSGATWAQQGSKLVGTGGVAPSWQGFRTALSANGDVLAVGGPVDSGYNGAFWIFTRAVSTWTQLGARVSTGTADDRLRNGSFVAVSGDGTLFVEGAPGAGLSAGAAYAFGRPQPRIVSVNDVPNDQGGQVSLRWAGSVLDYAPGGLVAGYGIWRQVPAGAVTVPGALRTATTEGGLTYYWEYVGSEPAHGFAGYSWTAPTLSDSVAGSNPRTLFMVEAQSTNAGVYWPSAPDSGYSVDNLGPLAPAGLGGTYASGSTQLLWNPNVEPDLGGYRLYRGAPATFTISPANLVAQLAPGVTSYLDPAGKAYIYKLTAVDAHGNESLPSTVVPGGVTGVDDRPAGELSLAAPRPNPAAGPTAIRFTLPRAGRVDLAVFDAAGRRVRTVVDGVLPAGEHEVRWDARGAGPAVGAGVYFVRLVAVGRTLVRRLAVVD